MGATLVYGLPSPPVCLSVRVLALPCPCIRACLRVPTDTYALCRHNNINIVAILTFAVLAKKNMLFQNGT